MGVEKILCFAGIDPGTTVGYCILDLDGEIVKFGSQKELSSDKLIEMFRNIGEIIIVACDKKKSPEFVKHVGIKLGAAVWSPKEDLAVTEKISFTKKNKYKNSHERDAIASVLMAYAAYTVKFEEIYSFLLEQNRLEIKDNFIKQVLRNGALNYHEILRMNEDKKVALTPKPKQHKQEKRNVLENVLKHNESLVKENERLRQENRLIKNKIKKEFDKITEIKDKNVSDKKLMEMLMFREKRYHILLKKFRDLERSQKKNYKKINRLLSYVKNKNDYLVVDYYSNLSDVKKADVLFVKNPNEFSSQSIKELNNLDITIISLEKVSSRIRNKIKAVWIEWEDQFFEINKDKVIILKDDLKKALENSSTVEDILNEYKEDRKSQLSQ